MAKVIPSVIAAWDDFSPLFWCAICGAEFDTSSYGECPDCLMRELFPLLISQ